MGFFDAIMGAVGGPTGGITSGAVGVPRVSQVTRMSRPMGPRAAFQQIASGTKQAMGSLQGKQPIYPFGAGGAPPWAGTVAQGAQQAMGGLKGMVNLGKLGPPSGSPFGPLYGNPALNNPAQRPTVDYPQGMNENTRLRLESEQAGYGYGGRQPDQPYTPGVQGGGGMPDLGGNVQWYRPELGWDWQRQQEQQAGGAWDGRSPYPGQSGAGDGGGGLIRLVAPTGEQKDVPPDVAEQMLARGARRI